MINVFIYQDDLDLTNISISFIHDNNFFNSGHFLNEILS